jgi:hypothetical protein
MDIHYSLDSSGFEPWWGVRITTPVNTSPEAPAVSCTVGTGVLFQVKLLGSGIYHTLPSIAEVKERELYTYVHSAMEK